MGRLIDESRVVEILQHTWLNGTIAYRFIDEIKRKIRIEVPTVEAIPKAEYEVRLKADMVAMLEDLDLQIDESVTYNLEVAKVQRLIRDKIDKLNENDNETDKSNK